MNKVKSIFIGILVVLSMTLGVAQASPVCKSLEEMAYNLQKARQVGMSISKAMQIADDLGANKQHITLIKGIVIRAYEVPRYSTESYQEKAAQEFSNEEAVRCYRSMV